MMSSIIASSLLVLVIAASSTPQSAAFVISPSSSSSSSRNLGSAIITPQSSQTTTKPLVVLYGSDWSGFGFIEDDEDDDIFIDKREYAKEEDDQEVKAQVGASLEPPSIDDATTTVDSLFVTAGTQLEMDEETVMRVLNACREEIGTVFGYTAENRGVGITGGVDYVELDGPVVVLRLKGRFWHERTTVLARVANYLQQRIPEIIDVIVEDEWQLTTEANDKAL